MSCQHIETHKLSSKDEQTLNRIFNPNLPFDDVSEEPQNLQVQELNEAEQKAKELELEGVKAAEASDVDSALDYFNQAVEVAPNWASGYNNRAQARRLKGNKEGAMEDLNKAIELSQSRGSAACQAFTQRAILKRVQGDEDGALEDFKSAAGLGSKFAKEMCISLNPYAALCNQMLSEVFQKVQRGEQ